MPETATTFFPFDSGAGALVEEVEWRAMAQHWRPTGVLAGVGNELEVFGDGSGLQIKVRSGAVSILGHYGEWDVTKLLPIGVGHASNPRIDLVVARADLTNNTVELDVVAGTPNVAPEAPTPVQSTTQWEIALGEVWVEANETTSIAASSAGDTQSGFRVDRRFLTPAGVQSIPGAPGSQVLLPADEAGFFWDRVSKILYVWDGAAFQQVYPPTVFVPEVVRAFDEVVTPENVISSSTPWQVTFNIPANWVTYDVLVKATIAITNVAIAGSEDVDFRFQEQPAGGGDPNLGPVWSVGIDSDTSHFPYMVSPEYLLIGETTTGSRTFHIRQEGSFPSEVATAGIFHVTATRTS